MDEELKQLAALALRNAFWRDFSGLVNAYCMAATGLDMYDFETGLGDLTSVYGRDTEAEVDYEPGIWAQGPGGRFDTCGSTTLLDALENEDAIEVHLRGQKVFERRDGEWYFTGGEC